MVLEFDHRMRSRVIPSFIKRSLPGSDFTPSEYLKLADGTRIEHFELGAQTTETLNDLHGKGVRHRLTGQAHEGLEKTVQIDMYERYPGFAILKVSYRNTTAKDIAVQAWTNCAHGLKARRPGALNLWSFSGASHEDRRDWVQAVKTGFSQRNFMGMNASDYGGGTPVVDIWRRDYGVAVGHVETTPKSVALPINTRRDQASIAVEYEQPVTLKPAEHLSTFDTFVAVHKGDYFATLDTYRRLMAERGLKSPQAPQEAYEPIWCAWGYERDFTLELIEGTLQKAKDVGLEWAVLDDGWQTSEGDWKIDRKKFPRGEDDMKRLVSAIKAAGLKPRLWVAPLAVDPGTDLLHDHTDMLLLNKNGAVQNISWWNSFYLCPAYDKTLAYTQALVRKILGEWGFAGLKIDGQHLNGVAPCYNPAHHHARPEESIEKLQDFWRAIYETAMEVNPNAVVEICPCGTSYAFHNLPAMNQAPASDPESSWQVRHKGKTLKALMGPSAAYSGDHVELSDHGDDFASSVGIGAVVSTKFTWPLDPDPTKGFALTPEKERVWRKWIALYNEKMLPKGRYLGELYDIGFDKPEAHVVEKDGRLYYAFYAKQWSGPVSIRGLGEGRYMLRDYFNDRPLGEASATSNTLSLNFQDFQLIEATPLRLMQG